MACYLKQLSTWRVDISCKALAPKQGLSCKLATKMVVYELEAPLISLVLVYKIKLAYVFNATSTSWNHSGGCIYTINYPWFLDIYLFWHSTIVGVQVRREVFLHSKSKLSIRQLMSRPLVSLCRVLQIHILKLSFYIISYSSMCSLMILLYHTCYFFWLKNNFFFLLILFALTINISCLDKKKNNVYKIQNLKEN